MTMNNPTVKILCTRTSKRSTAAVPTLVLTERQVNFKVLPHVGDVTVLVVTVRTLVPLVLASKTTSAPTQVTMRPILVTMVNLILHAPVAVRTYDIFRPCLANARRIDTTDFKLKIHVGQRLACVCKRHLFVTMLAVDNLDPATVPTQPFLYIALLVRRMALGALSHLFASTLLARGDVERLMTLALHAELDEPWCNLYIPLEG